MKRTWPHALWAIALCLACLPAHAQISTMPLDEAPESHRDAPPVLPQRPRHPALSAVASGGSGGMSYSGPNGAMNTSPEGSSCAVNCGGRNDQHAIDCGRLYTAYCQCDTQPYAVCKPQ